MARPGYLGGNTARNTQVVGAVKLFIRLDGFTDWINLGSMSGIELEPTSEYLEYSSHGRGVNAVVKRILTSRSMSMSFTLEEINSDNLRYAFLGDQQVSGTVNILESGIFTVGSSDDIVLDTPSVAIPQAYSLDGEERYLMSGTEPTINYTLLNGFGYPVPPEGTDVMVIYWPDDKAAGTDTEKFEMLASSVVSGDVQFRIRNKHGGLAQIYEFDSVELAPTGAVGVAAEEIQSIPMQLTIRELSSKFGRVYTKSVAST